MHPNVLILFSVFDGKKFDLYFEVLFKIIDITQLNITNHGPKVPFRALRVMMRLSDCSCLQLRDISENLILLAAKLSFLTPTSTYL